MEGLAVISSHVAKFSSHAPLRTTTEQFLLGITNPDSFSRRCLTTLIWVVFPKLSLKYCRQQFSRYLKHLSVTRWGLSKTSGFQYGSQKITSKTATATSASGMTAATISPNTGKQACRLSEEGFQMEGTWKCLQQDLCRHATTTILRTRYMGEGAMFHSHSSTSGSTWHTLVTSMQSKSRSTSLTTFNMRTLLFLLDNKA
jgi:hypothetical protein